MMKKVRGPVSKFIFRAALLLLLVVAAVQLGLLLSSRSNLQAQPLMPARIAELRQQYPTAVGGATVSLKPFSKGYVASRDAYIVAVVIDKSPDITQTDLIVPEEDMKAQMELYPDQAKLIQNINTYQYTMAKYKIRVEGIIFQGDGSQLSVGHEIIVSANKDGFASIPDLIPGTMLVMGISTGSEDPDRIQGYIFSFIGLFYLVDQEYVLPVYEETGRGYYTGITLSQFKQDLLAMWKDPINVSYVHFISEQALLSAMSGEWPAGTREGNPARLEDIAKKTGLRKKGYFRLRSFSPESNPVFISLTDYPLIAHQNYKWDQSTSALCTLSWNLDIDFTSTYLAYQLADRALIESSRPGFYISQSMDAMATSQVVAWVQYSHCFMAYFSARMGVEAILALCDVVPVPLG